ncbi:MAG: TolC family protein [Saprospiraceae bacterium]
MVAKRSLLIIFGYLLAFVLPMRGQSSATLELADCQQLALSRYPLQQQKPLLEQAHRLKLAQLDAQRMPSIFWKAKTTYQSETVSLPFVLPGQDAAFKVPKFNGQTTLEGNYVLYDGGAINANQALQAAMLAKDLQAVEVSLYPVKEQVQQLYFGVLLLRTQDQVLANSIGDLQQRLANLAALEKHGVGLPLNSHKLEVQVLTLEKRRADLQGQEESLLALLGDLMGQTLTAETILAPPSIPAVTFDEGSQRPELSLFSKQKQVILEQSKLIDIQQKPKVSAFLQAGVGYANPLNFFDDNLSPFAIGGIQFQWNIWDGKQGQKQKDWLLVQSQLVDNQAATFEYQQRLLDQQYLKEAQKIATLMVRDKEVIQLQETILQQVNAQLAQGIITSTEYVSELNTQINAKLELALHELQLQQLKVTYLTKKGVL